MAINLLRRSAITACQTTRFLRPTSAPSYSSYSQNNSESNNAAENVLTLNRFQKSGPTPEFVLRTSEDSNFKVIRVVMPGVSNSGVMVWLNKENNGVFFKGVGEIEVEFEEERTYEGGVILEAKDEFKIEEITKAEMKNGILWITLKRTSG